MHPYIHTNDLEGAVWVPEDAVANPLAICKAFAQLAVEGGEPCILTFTESSSTLSQIIFFKKRCSVY